MNPQFVLFHQPGPQWQAGPFLDGAAGGMVMFKPGVTEEQALEIATADPTIQSGLLEFEIRPWFSAPWAGVLTNAVT